MSFETILNDVPFGQSDYRVYCGSASDGWDLIDMQARRVQKLAISLQGFFDSTYKDVVNAALYAQKVNGKGVYYPVFITLTYRDQSDWNPKQISSLIDFYRKDWQQRLGRNPKHFRYVWVAEMQKRGVVHYHLVLWCPRGKSLAVPDLPVGKNELVDKKGKKYYRYGSGWSYGNSNICGVRKGVIGYLGKYLSKGSQPADHEGHKVYFPKGCRIFGMGGLSSAERAKIAYKKLPKYVREYFSHEEGRVVKMVGGYKQGRIELTSPYTFFVLKLGEGYVPAYDVKNLRGRLTCIMISYECSYVMLCDKDKYLSDLKDVSRET